MIKKLSIIVFLSSYIYAQNKAIDFDEFLNNALQNSPYLKALNLSINLASQEGKKLTRYENPSLAIAFSQFEPDIGSRGNGFSVAVSQPVRLWGVGSDKNNLAYSMKEKAKSNVLFSRATLVQNISLMFVQYAKKKELYNLAKKELEIILRIYEITQARLEAGTVSQGKMLQVKVDYERIEVYLDFLELSAKQEYFKLLEIAGYSQEINLSHTYDFKVKNRTSLLENPALKLFKNVKKEAIAQAKVNTNKVEWVELVAEYEKEPQENIFRIGLSVPLAVFNTKKEEISIANLQSKSADFASQKESRKLTLKMLSLKSERELLEKLKTKNEKTLQTQERLLKMFEESYKIANINLIELQNIRNRVIKTKESAIKIKFATDANSIQTNYITGAYNE